MITYEEYENAVLKALPKGLGISASEAKKYIKTEDAQDAIKGNYKSCLSKYKNGEISKEIFLGDGVYGTVLCLSLLY